MSTEDDDKKKVARRVKTVPFRMSFPALLKPRANEDDDGKATERYELTMLFPPGTFNKAPFYSAFTAAMIQEHGSDKSKWPKLKRKPDDVMRDFAEYNSEANKPLAGNWAGWTMVRANASTKQPPGVVGAVRGPDGKFPVITDDREVYGGRWGRATVEAYYYENKKGGKGVTLGLVNVQLLKHDTKFGHAVTAPETDFDDDVAPEWSGAADDFDQGAAPAGEAKTEDAGW